jgi:hypothetical protein
MAVVKDGILDLSIGKIPMLKVLFLYVIGILIAVRTNSLVAPNIVLFAIAALITIYIVIIYFNLLPKKNLFSVIFGKRLWKLRH